MVDIIPCGKCGDPEAAADAFVYCLACHDALIFAINTEASVKRAILGIAEKVVEGIHPFDYEQALCYWCSGGWERIPGPRGGAGRITHTGKHKPDCPYDALSGVVQSWRAGNSMAE